MCHSQIEPPSETKTGSARRCSRAQLAAMEEYKPAEAMVVTQCIYAALALWSKAAFTGGMSPLVFVVYRQAVATIVLVPVVVAANRYTHGAFLPLAAYQTNQRLCSTDNSDRRRS